MLFGKRMTPIIRAFDLLVFATQVLTELVRPLYINF